MAFYVRFFAMPLPSAGGSGIATPGSCELCYPAVVVLLLFLLSAISVYGSGFLLSIQQ